DDHRLRRHRVNLPDRADQRDHRRIGRTRAPLHRRIGRRRAGARVRAAVTVLHAADAGRAAGVHRHARRAGDAARAADRVRDRVRRALHARRTGHLRGDRRRHRDPERRRRVLGARRRSPGLVVARKARFRDARQGAGKRGTAMNARESLPLAGVRVVEFCQVAAGPFCGMLLADFGAEVIKVEPREGDGLRQWPPIRNGFSENFASLNRGKRSLVLDLKDPADRDVARALVLDADVLVENNRPGVMQRLGLGSDWFGPRKPSLVYCSISAYGQSGPRAAEGGFDLTIQAAAGVMSVTGEPDGAPVKCGVPLADFTAGLYGAFSIASMIARVRAGGPGGQLDVPRSAPPRAVAALPTSEYFGTGRNPRKLGSAHPRNAPYQAYRARDGWFAIAAGNDRLWRAVCEVVALPELLADERFASTT